MSDGQEAIKRYKAEYDATTAELEKLAKLSDAKFIENPAPGSVSSYKLPFPMTTNPAQ